MPFILQDGRLIEVTDAQFAEFGGGEAQVRRTTAADRRRLAAEEAAAGGQNIQTTSQSNPAGNQQIINPNTTNNSPGQTLSKVPAPLREEDIPPGDESLYEYNLQGNLVRASSLRNPRAQDEGVSPPGTTEGTIDDTPRNFSTTTEIREAPPIPGLERPRGFRTDEVSFTTEELNAAGITNVPANAPVRPTNRSSTTTSQATVTGGSVTTTTVTPTTYRDTAQSNALQAEANDLGAQKEARVAALRAEGKTGAQILRDPEYRSLSQQQQVKQNEAESAKEVDQAGTVSTTTTPGATGTVNEQTVDGQYLTTQTSGDDPTAASGQVNQFVASGGPVRETSAAPVPAGEDPYVDLQDEGNNVTQFEGTIDQLEPEPASSPYEDETDGGITEFTADDEVRWSEEDTAGEPNPYFADEEEGTLTEFESNTPDVFEPEGVDPEEDPYAELVDETEAEGGLVEFTENGPVGRDTQELAQIQAQAQATLANARAQAALKAQRKQADDGDWRVKLRLAPGSDYLYRANDGSGGQAGILQPLVNTDGVIFPYTPTIQTNYKANYNSYDLTHSNYRGYFYQGSSVDEINLTATFTAQDTYEAQYLLAVIHFFRSVTKMFYGKDGNAGTPPPLVFLQGLGEYQYNLHPCVVSSFTYNLPNDVDYIRARSPNQANLPAGLLQRRQRQTVATNPFSAAWERLKAAGVPKGGVNQTPAPPALGTKSPTYVPTKIDIQLVLLPVQSRSQVSNNFSLQKYANGDLLKGGFW